ncbi:hypothetical protein D3C81_1817450 [compost metagenome]
MAAGKNPPALLFAPAGAGVVHAVVFLCLWASPERAERTDPIGHAPAQLRHRFATGTAPGAKNLHGLDGGDRQLATGGERLDYADASLEVRAQHQLLRAGGNAAQGRVDQRGAR